MTNIPNNNEKVAIFGAGFYGNQALEQIGSDNVMFFIDNAEEKAGQFFHDKMIKSFTQFLQLEEKPHVILASLYSDSMAKQMKEAGYTDYSFFLGEYKKFYETDELIVNPYETVKEATTEEEWMEGSKLLLARKSVNDAVEELYGEDRLFNHIEVETINRCNGSCSFCPVNYKVDPREKKIMSETMFKSIVGQLEEIRYTGRFTTFSNNEPLLDERIIEFNRYAREHLPNAKMHLYTNGTLMTIDIFEQLVEMLDELIIDNYQQELRLIKPCLEIIEYCEAHPELKKKVTIVLRKPNEILTSRGGDAPNRKNTGCYAKDRCILPFKQMIIRPDGKVSLCCNDAIGKYTLGDLTKEKLIDIWYGPRFSMVRKCLYEGRENWGNCQFCDTFIMG